MNAHVGHPPFADSRTLFFFAPRSSRRRDSRSCGVWSANNRDATDWTRLSNTAAIQRVPPCKSRYLFITFIYTFAHGHCTSAYRAFHAVATHAFVWISVLYLSRPPSLSLSFSLSRAPAHGSVREFSNNARDICIRASKHDTALSVCMRYGCKCKRGGKNGRILM